MTVKIQQAYSQAALLAKHSATLEQEAEVWRSVVELHDLTLDYQIAANERLSLVNEAIQCQTLPMPAGLFPDLI